MASRTSRDVARLAGVSQSTVSYVMSGKRPISDETRTRVLAAMDELTYEPNAGARALASARSSVIGLVVPFGAGADTGGLLPFIETIAQVARSHDHEVLLVTAAEGSDGLRRLAGRRLCDAILLLDIRCEDDRVPLAAELGLPVVLIGVPDEAHGLPCVDVDFAGGARAAVAELARTGHDRVVLLGHPAEVMSLGLNFVGRFAGGARDEAARHGLRLDEVSPVEWGRQGARDAVRRVLDGHRPGERLGVVVSDANTTQPVLHALAAAGLTPGRDVSVIAVLTDELAAEAEPPVTNVSLRPQDVSRRAMETLFEMLAGGSPAADVNLLSMHMTVRDTVMPPR